MITIDGNEPVVCLESPFHHDDPSVKALYARYLKAAALDCFRRGEIPFASHAIYTQWLDDLDPNERAAGIEAGLALVGRVASRSVVYTDLGVSSGMLLGVSRAADCERPVEYRRLYGDWTVVGNYLEGYDHGKARGSAIPGRTGAFEAGRRRAMANLPRDWSKWGDP